MFNKTYEERLAVWSQFRDSLEDSDDPFQDVIEFYKLAPCVSIHTDPWDSQMWPTAWELLQENQYCDFCRVLSYYFSLQLTERFSDANFEIHICTTREENYFYILVVNQKWVLGYDETQAIDISTLPKEVKSQVVYDMSEYR